MAMTTATLVKQLNTASDTYHVPAPILFGVFGMETAFGNNVKTSSTGAMGTMQFEPATARAYNYPLTNTPTPAQAQQQFDAAAHYLSDLFHQHGGNWDAALKAYSGGGYGLAQVEAKSKSATGVAGAAKYFGGIKPAIDIPTPKLPNPLSGIDAIANLITSGQFWLRVGEVLAGAILIALGLNALTGRSGNPVTVARSVASHV